MVLGLSGPPGAWAQKVERGLASWYGAPYHGRESASGEIYDQEQLTAAHRTLPFGTKVRVRRVNSTRSVIVRINDRGPFVDSRIIDVSHAAAVRLGLDKLGVAPVTVKVVEPPAAVSFDITPLRNGDRAVFVIAKRQAPADLYPAAR
jgi:rare lipoprotein A